MRKILLFILLSYFNINAQTWKSISKFETFKYIPYRQFIINQHINEIWFVQNQYVTKIKNDGEIVEYNESNLNGLWSGINLSFTFAPNKTYFCKDYEGIYQLNESTSDLIYPISNIFNVLSNNEDTVYATIPFEPYIKLVNSINVNSTQYGDNIFSKNSFFYKSGYTDGNLVRITGSNPNDFVDFYSTDPEYLSYFFNETKFSRLSDTLYVACKKGISFAYNYDFLDTITPNNTSNMPSANVLEMEFDHLDRLWAVFGDTNDQAFSLAMLENDTWVNYFDANNSPIEFVNSNGQNSFRGLEIDTLGNIWVCDNNALHTLLSPTTPLWVGLHATKKENFSVFPNPTENKVSIHFDVANTLKEISLKDLKGNELISFENFDQDISLSLENLSSGVYILEVWGNKAVSYRKIVKK